MSEKIYVGNGKKKEAKFGDIIKLSFSEADLDTLKQNLNERGYVNLDCCERKQIDKYGNSHYMTIDNWEPDPNYGPKGGSDDDGGDIPF